MVIIHLVFIHKGVFLSELTPIYIYLQDFSRVHGTKTEHCCRKDGGIKDQSIARGKSTNERRSDTTRNSYICKHQNDVSSHVFVYAQVCPSGCRSRLQSRKK